MIPVNLRRPGLGPAPSPGFSGPRRLIGSSASGGGPPPTGMGGSPPRLRMSGKQYLAGRGGWKNFLNQRSAARKQANAPEQARRAAMAALSGGRLSTGRSHRGFASGMGAYARRGGGSGGAEEGGESRALTPYRLGTRTGGGKGDLPAAMEAYFSRRDARRQKYAAMRGGVSPQRDHAPGPETSADEGAEHAPALEPGSSIEEAIDDTPATESSSPQIEEID